MKRLFSFILLTILCIGGAIAQKTKDVIVMPEFPGGMPALMEFLQNEIRYPKKCREAGIEGRTVITFVVKKNGKIKDIEVARSSGNKQLDKEAIRVIKKMPKWKPGMQDGKNVNVLFALPITFKLR